VNKPEKGRIIIIQNAGTIPERLDFWYHGHVIFDITLNLSKFNRKTQNPKTYELITGMRWAIRKKKEIKIEPVWQKQNPQNPKKKFLTFFIDLFYGG